MHQHLSWIKKKINQEVKGSGSRISFVTSKLPKKTCTNTEDMKPHRRSHSRFTPWVYSWGANHQAIMLVLHMKYINLYLGTKAGKVLYKSLKNFSFSTVRLRNKTGLDTLVWVSCHGGNSDPPSWSKNSGTILLTPNGTLFSGRVALLCLIHLSTLTCWFGLLCFFSKHHWIHLRCVRWIRGMEAWSFCICLFTFARSERLRAWLLQGKITMPFKIWTRFLF